MPKHELCKNAVAYSKGGDGSCGGATACGSVGSLITGLACRKAATLAVFVTLTELPTPRLEYAMPLFEIDTAATASCPQVAASSATSTLCLRELIVTARTRPQFQCNILLFT